MVVRYHPTSVTMPSTICPLEGRNSTSSPTCKQGEARGQCACQKRCPVWSRPTAQKGKPARGTRLRSGGSQGRQEAGKSTSHLEGVGRQDDEAGEQVLQDLAASQTHRQATNTTNGQHCKETHEAGNGRRWGQRNLGEANVASRAPSCTTCWSRLCERNKVPSRPGLSPPITQRAQAEASTDRPRVVLSTHPS